MSMTKNKKRFGIILAILIALAIILSGTWAWYDFTQRYTNVMHSLAGAHYDPTLVDLFEMVNNRVKEKWELNETLSKRVYVTYDHEDENYKPEIDHTYNEDEGRTYLPTWIRVNLTEKMTVTNVDTGVVKKEGPTVYNGEELSGSLFNFVDWKKGSSIKTVEAWTNEGCNEGPFWILDTDGWFYWAQPLPHGKYTEDILEAVTLFEKTPLQQIDYSIDVHMEAIDEGLIDFGKWLIPQGNDTETDGSCKPGVSTGIRPLWGLGSFGVDPNGMPVTVPDFPHENGNDVASTTVFQDAAGNFYIANNTVFSQSNTAMGVPVKMMWDSTTPMTQANVKDMKQGWHYKYIQKPDGSWWSVGDNRFGQLSNGTTDTVSYPVQMKWDSETSMDSSNVKQIIAGSHHAFILKNDGQWYGVGWNLYGGLSTGDTASAVSYPVAAMWDAETKISESNVSKIVAGYLSTYFLKSDDNKWYASGYNDFGQLSDGTRTSRTYPIGMRWADEPNNEITSDTQLMSGGYTIYLVKKDGSWWGLGQNNLGQIADGTTKDKAYPVAMKWSSAAEDFIKSPNVKKYSIGWGTCYILKSDNNWYSIGDNRYGQSSVGTVESTPPADGTYPRRAMWDENTPMTDMDVKEVRINMMHCVRFQKLDGSWWAAGSNGGGNLVDGTTVDRSYPVKMLWDDGTQIGSAIYVGS